MQRPESELEPESESEGAASLPTQSW
eukprot:COSAG01_NODE_35445_length_531_cov_7.451389_2_plen_25_part_01